MSHVASVGPLVGTGLAFLEPDWGYDRVRDGGWRSVAFDDAWCVNPYPRSRESAMQWELPRRAKSRRELDDFSDFGVDDLGKVCRCGHMQADLGIITPYLPAGNILENR